MNKIEHLNIKSALISSTVYTSLDLRRSRRNKRVSASNVTHTSVSQSFVVQNWRLRALIGVIVGSNADIAFSMKLKAGDEKEQPEKVCSQILSTMASWQLIQLAEVTVRVNFSSLCCVV